MFAVSILDDVEKDKTRTTETLIRRLLVFSSLLCRIGMETDTLCYFIVSCLQMCEASASLINHGSSVHLAVKHVEDVCGGRTMRRIVLPAQQHRSSKEAVNAGKDAGSQAFQHAFAYSVLGYVSIIRLYH